MIHSFRSFLSNSHGISRSQIQSVNRIQTCRFCVMHDRLHSRSSKSSTLFKSLATANSKVTFPIFDHPSQYGPTSDRDRLGSGICDLHVRKLGKRAGVHVRGPARGA